VAGLIEHQKKLKDLLESIDSCYKIVQANKEEWLSDLGRRDILKQMAEQTAEFSYFVRDYSKTMNFGKCLCGFTRSSVIDATAVLKAYKNSLTTVDDKINEFKSNFKDLEDALVQRTTIRIELAVFRVLDKLEDIGMLQ
jgi:3-methyladenine DNA glycosylase AlkD